MEAPTMSEDNPPKTFIRRVQKALSVITKLDVPTLIQAMCPIIESVLPGGKYRTFSVYPADDTGKMLVTIQYEVGDNRHSINLIISRTDDGMELLADCNVRSADEEEDSSQFDPDLLDYQMRAHH